MALIKVTLHRFKMADVEDPEIYCAEPLWHWQQTDYGRWCIENCFNNSVTYSIFVDPTSHGYLCVISGELTETDYIFHQLKWRDYGEFDYR